MNKTIPNDKQAPLVLRVLRGAAVLGMRLLIILVLSVTVAAGWIRQLPDVIEGTAS